MSKERRKQRSQNTTMALCLQLDACRRAARLTGMVLSDRDGLTLATAGDSKACREIAARLPLLGQKTERFEGVLYSAEADWEICMERFHAANSELYLCAIGGRADQRVPQVQHSRQGVTRILESARG